MSKVDKNKQIKRKSLLETAFKLFTSKGIHNTSVSDIVKGAGMAKGTFYLYFKDKYDIRNKLIAHKASELFRKADKALRQTAITESVEKVIFLADNIISQFEQDKTLLGFISKKLSWGVFKNVLIEENTFLKENTSTQDSIVVREEESDVDFYDIFHSVFEDESKYENIEIMIFMIIELVGSTCYSSILHNEPVEIDQLKPYIFRTIRQIMEAHEIREP